MPSPQTDDGVADARAVVAVDDRDEEIRRLVAQRALGKRAVERESRCEVRLPLARAAARSDQPYDHQQDPYVSTTGSGSSSANGSKVPPVPADSTSSEKKQVITRPSRKSPSRASRPSPAAIAIARSR